MKTINWEVTKQLQSEERFINFHKWLKENNVKYDSIEYPVAFGKSGALLGIAAKRPIGPGEAYIYIPTKLIINDDKIHKSEIGFIIERHSDVFREHLDGEYLRLIFFIAFEMTKGEKSFWHPYFQISENTDLPCFWNKEDLEELEDELLKAEIREYKEEYDAEYSALFEIASLYPEVIDITKFTEEVFKKAFTITVTRCFGWSLPYTMVVPFADCANHFIIDNQYEMFNSRLQKKKVQSEQLTVSEEKYFTQCKMRVNCMKHFTNEENGDQFDPNYEVPYKTKRYIRKLTMRNECMNISAYQFLNDEKYRHLDVWDLKYISTSDEEDNDSSGDEDSDSEKDEKEEPEITQQAQEDYKEELIKALKDTTPTPTEKIWKEDQPEKNKYVPEIAKKLRPAKKKQRVYFTYSYDNRTGEGGKAEPKKSVVVKKRVEGRQPENLIELLIMQKQYLYEQEQRMKILKEQDEEEWAKMTQEYNSSEEEDDEENFSWYNDEDKDTYFVLCTKYKNVYEKGQQVFHCYGRRTNRFLLLNYGFCLNNNKYNSLSFRVWVNFNWQEEHKKEQERKLKGENIESSSDEEGKDNRISKVIRLKRNKIGEEIFAYLRANLLNTYKGKNLEYLLVSAPVDAEFEMLVVACTINLLKGLLASRFKKSFEDDRKLLQDENLSYRRRFAILHRMNAKEVLNENIKMCEILMRLLARFKDGRNFKYAYMGIIDDFETEQEIMINRIKVRKYLRELVVNQKRVLEAAKDQEYIKKVKEYFEEKWKKEADEEAHRIVKEDQEDEYYDEEDEEEEKQN